MTTDITQKIFGRNLARLRKNVVVGNKFLTQEVLARLLGLSTQQIRKYEKGIDRPSPLVLRKLCKIFGVSGDELLMIEKKPDCTNHVRLCSKHRVQVSENIRLLLSMEGKQWQSD